MRVRFLLTMLIALVMAMAPQAMPIGEAAAAAPAHHGQMASAEHCPEQPQPNQPDPADKGCCLAGCMTAAALPNAALESPMPAGASERPAPDNFRRGFLAEIATPPPRLV